MNTNDESIIRTREWYNEHADEYTAHTRDAGLSLYHSYYEKPAMYALLPTDLTGLTVLSLGCGSGEDCEYLRKQGAKVSGIDISDKLINNAQKAYKECNFFVGTMDDLSMFSDLSIDIVYSSLAVHYLDSWEALMKEVNRVLRPGGFFLFSMGHPINYSFEKVSINGVTYKGIFSFNNEDGTKTFVGDYFGKTEHTNTSSMPGVITYPKTVEKVSDLVYNNGFFIERIAEPLPLEQMKEFNAGSYTGLQKSPYFILYKLRKQTT